MQSILEYLKQREKQEYSPIEPHYGQDGKFDGVMVTDDRYQFVLLRVQLKTSYGDAQKSGKLYDGRIPTRDEWTVIRTHLKDINKIFLDNKCKTIDVFDEFWADSRNRSEAWIYSLIDPEAGWYSQKRNMHLTRFVKDI